MGKHLALRLLAAAFHIPSNLALKQLMFFALKISSDNTFQLSTTLLVKKYNSGVQVLISVNFEYQKKPNEKVLKEFNF